MKTIHKVGLFVMTITIILIPASQQDPDELQEDLDEDMEKWREGIEDLKRRIDETLDQLRKILQPEMDLNVTPDKNKRDPETDGGIKEIPDTQKDIPKVEDNNFDVPSTGQLAYIGKDNNGKDYCYSHQTIQVTQIGENVFTIGGGSYVWAHQEKINVVHSSEIVDVIVNLEILGNNIPLEFEGYDGIALIKGGQQTIMLDSMDWGLEHVQNSKNKLHEMTTKPDNSTQATQHIDFIMESRQQS